jgi:hypothetical protein
MLSGRQEIVLQVVADPAGLAHAGGGDDDLRLLVEIDGLALLVGDGEPTPGLIRGLCPESSRARASWSKILPVALEIDAGGLVGQRRVHIDREIPVPGHEPVHLESGG